ncbi:MAG: anaerobic ribonucleoside-triphosphate reductase activating protein [Victivallaceae bacterium]|nr:anaerobic ribonucleoside-triphosphate reductase activating protein [Victivallaceae bacterium]
MRFGLQKLTLLDYPGKVACTVFCCGCNFRCPFCHNASLVTGREEEMALDRDELFAFLRSRAKILDGVAVTGGEPLLHAEVPALLKEIKSLGFAVKLDTNGSFPETLEKLISEAVVDYVAVDIKNAPEKYAETCGGIAALEKVRQSVGLLKQSAVDYEFRTTVVKPFHEKGDFAAIGRWIAGAPRYFLQSFTDSGDLLAPSETMGAASDAELAEFLAEVKHFVPNAALRGK